MASSVSRSQHRSDALSEGLAERLAQGHFRLVLELDEAPQELVTLAGGLESDPKKTLDL